MANSHVIAKYEGIVATLRQIKTSADKLDFITLMIPQKIENGKLYNFKGKEIGAFDADDQELVDASRVLEATKVTDALMNDVFNPLNKLFGSAGERDTAKESDEELRPDTDENDMDDIPAIDEEDILDALEDALDKGDATEARKQLALLPKSNDEYDDMKKLVDELVAKSEPKIDDFIEDIEDALEDNDFEDAYAILKEMGRKHPKHKEMKQKIEDAEAAATKKDEPTDLVDDIEDAIEDGDIDAAKKLLEKLGEDHDEYTRLRRVIRKAGRN